MQAFLGDSSMNRLIVLALLALVIGPAAFAAAQSPNSGQRTTECTQRANERHLNGADRQEFVNWCVAHTDVESRRYPECASRADQRGLLGDSKGSFINSCV